MVDAIALSSPSKIFGIPKIPKPEDKLVAFYALISRTNAAVSQPLD